MSGWWAWGISPLTVAHCVLTATCRLLQRDRRRHKGWGPAGSLGPGGGRAFSLGAGRWAHGSWQAGERGVGEWQGCGGQGPPFHRRTGTTLPSPLPGPPPLPGCCRPCHGSCHLPPPFVRPFRSPPLECSSVWEKAQCLHPSQTSCSLVPDRVTSMSGSSPCHGDASRPAVPQAGAQGNLLHHGPVLHPCLAILQVHSPGGGPLQPSKQPVALHKLRFMSLVI